MKIIARDNYNRETVSDILITENITNKLIGEKIVKLLNQEKSDKFYLLVSDDTKLYKFEP